MDFLVSSASNLDVLWRCWLWGSSFSQAQNPMSIILVIEQY
ncbi:hypothetical protein NC652_007065 [Populus alba x Populus x berolinensis]|uniref:Uncharacterized protein n=1 Tax=Populus alba x Populus x berolinensis TaxID=444605 RepID=A0AAD6RFN9_9ROSI|nr:hypothetical protein NC651_006815 [Populus alba x Populus x berolinensis]KAJ6955844.1 hypothetical protein NC652_007065 [Populus alba x Populus x berolinensis]KAJ7008145.1 hypothetical protein NC653_006993 [Populus alba x Populus x berolinensis]